MQRLIRSLSSLFLFSLFFPVIILTIAGILSSCEKNDIPARILVFSKTEAFRHDCIPTAVSALRKLCADNGIAMDSSEEEEDFTRKNLKRYNAVVCLNTTGDVLNPLQEAEFERYIQAGGGFVGIHSGTDTEYGWGWFGDLVGGYFNGHPQPHVKLNKPGNGNAKAGEQIAGMCAACHSVDGNALSPEIPSLAGQPAEYLIKAMKDYRDGHRSDPMMVEAVRKLQDQTVADLAAYYAGQRPESPLQRASQSEQKFDPVADGRRIAGSCNGCHGKNGNSEKTGVPSLTGLHVKYLAAATRTYRDGVRKHDVMKKMVGRLSNMDIEKVSFYYATQEPISTRSGIALS